MNLQLKAHDLKTQITGLLRAYPELVEDEELRVDMLDGETDLHKVATQALNELREAETMALALREREKAQAARRGRYERKVDAMKHFIKSLMFVADIPKLTLDEATITTREPSLSVVVSDENELPQGFYQLARKPDKKAIKAAIEAGDEIPGATLAFGESGLTIRTK